jgi:Arc/MetJ family transcription regulator
MKTTIDIPDAVLKEAMRHTKAVSKRDAVVKAMEEYNRRQRLARLAAKLGTSETFMTFEELMKRREQDKSRTYA